MPNRLMTGRASYRIVVVLTTILFGGACAGGAVAADLAYKAVPPSPAFDWTGFYAGVHAGYATGDGNGAPDVSGPLFARFPGGNNLALTRPAPFDLGGWTAYGSPRANDGGLKRADGEDRAACECRSVGGNDVRW